MLPVLRRTLVLPSPGLSHLHVSELNIPSGLWIMWNYQQKRFKTNLKTSWAWTSGPTQSLGIFFKGIDYLRWRSSDIFILSHSERNDKMRFLLGNLVKSVSLDEQWSRMSGFGREVMKNYMDTQVVSNMMGPRDKGSERLSNPRRILSYLCSQTRPKTPLCGCTEMWLDTYSFHQLQFLLNARCGVLSSLFTLIRFLHKQETGIMIPTVLIGL